MEQWLHIYRQRLWQICDCVQRNAVVGRVVIWILFYFNDTSRFHQIFNKCKFYYAFLHNDSTIMTETLPNLTIFNGYVTKYHLNQLLKPHFLKIDSSISFVCDLYASAYFEPEIEWKLLAWWTSMTTYIHALKISYWCTVHPDVNLHVIPRRQIVNKEKWWI